MSGLAMAAPTVTETVLPNGDSEITVTDDGDVVATYQINLSTHHSPATSPDDPLVQKFESTVSGRIVQL